MDTQYETFCMQGLDYAMKSMSTYGGLTVKDGQRVSKRVFQKDGEMHKKTFQYTEPFSNHFDFRYIVDNHNHIRHMFPSIEEIWTIHR